MIKKEKMPQPEFIKDEKLERRFQMSVYFACTNIENSRVKMIHEFYLFVAHGFHFSTKSIKSAQIASHHEIRHTFNVIVLCTLNKKAKKYT